MLTKKEATEKAERIRKTGASARVIKPKAKNTGFCVYTPTANVTGAKPKKTAKVAAKPTAAKATKAKVSKVGATKTKKAKVGRPKTTKAKVGRPKARGAR